MLASQIACPLTSSLIFFLTLLTLSCHVKFYLTNSQRISRKVDHHPNAQVVCFKANARQSLIQEMTKGKNPSAEVIDNSEHA